MIVLDTNVVSEIMRPRQERSAAVVAWLRGVSSSTLATTAITFAEIGVGIHKLPAGRRREDLMAASRRAFELYFPDRVLPFDQAAAERFGALVGERRRKGRHFHGFDFAILAIAASRGFSVATRNSSDFDDVGVNLINPWDQPAP